MATEAQDRLATEISFYFAHKRAWLKKHTGSFVVVQGTNVLGFYPSFETAFRAGVLALGVREDFLVRQVLEEEPVFCIYSTVEVSNQLQSLSLR